MSKETSKFIDGVSTTITGIGVGLFIILVPVLLWNVMTERAKAEPLFQDPGQQVNVFSGATITTTAQTATTACGQGGGAIGRKTLSVINAGGGGVVTVTAELRATSAVSNHTTSHLAINSLAAGSASSDTTTPDEAAGRFCQISAVSASTSTITVTLRRE